MGKGADYQIEISRNEELRTLTIKDNGIGLSEAELVDNLGTIAKSGTKEFKEKLESAKDLESEQGFKWVSDGASRYTITEIDKEEVGTEITLFLRENNEELEENYDDFLKEYRIKQLVKKYSDYVRYPIKMEVTKFTTPEDEKEEPTEYKELETLNSMIPLWRQNKNDITEEAYSEFYKHQFNGYDDPMKVIHSKVEGLTEYTSLLFIPKSAPFDLYSEKYEKGLQLYSKGVFIMDKNKDLLPDYFRFVKGLVDSSDLSLNISREILQQDRLVKKIATSVEKKIKAELEKMMKKDRDSYNELYSIYGVNFKYGIYEGFGMNKEKLQDLIMFKTTKNDDYVSLKEYVENMPEDQKYIYYASGKTKESILSLPQMDLVKDKDFEVLLFTDDIDQFMVNILQSYEEKEFKSINQGDLDLLDKKEEKQLDKLSKEKEPFLSAVKDALEGKVKEVVLSKRLKDSPVCLVSGDGISMEMEKVLKNLPNGQDAKATQILEINPNHHLFSTLEKVFENNAESISKYAQILYNQ